MLNEIKLALRRTSTTLDNEIKDNIETALLELSRVGVNVKGITSESKNVNKLIIKACELYCKAQFNFMSKGELFQKNFEALRDALAVTSQYTDEVSE